jgi:hypothetical protein
VREQCPNFEVRPDPENHAIRRRRLTANRLRVETHHRSDRASGQTSEDVLITQLRFAVVDARTGFFRGGRQRGCRQVAHAFARAGAATRKVEVEVDDDVDERIVACGLELVHQRPSDDGSVQRSGIERWVLGRGARGGPSRSTRTAGVGLVRHMEWGSRLDGNQEPRAAPLRDRNNVLSRRSKQLPDSRPALRER